MQGSHGYNWKLTTCARDCSELFLPSSPSEQSVKSFAKLSRAFAQLLRAEYFQVKELLPDVLVTRYVSSILYSL